MTGLDDHHAGMDAIRMGAQDYLPKGQLTPGLLIRTVLYSAERKRWQVALGHSYMIIVDEGFPQRYKADVQKIN